MNKFISTNRYKCPVKLEGLSFIGSSSVYQSIQEGPLKIQITNGIIQAQAESAESISVSLVFNFHVIARTPAHQAS